MHAVPGGSFDRENPFERVRRFASFRKNILDQVTTTHQDNTGTRLVLQPDAALFPVPLFLLLLLFNPTQITNLLILLPRVTGSSLL